MSDKTIKDTEKSNINADEPQHLDELDDDEELLALPFEQQNLALIIGHRKLFVCKEKLMAESLFFDKMFKSDFKEADANEISLPGKKLSHFIRFLRYILPGFDDEITEETVHDMLPLADEYQTEKLLQRIQRFLVNYIQEKGDSINSGKMVDYILEAERYNLGHYLDACIQASSRKKYKNFEKQPCYIKITPDTRLKILSAKAIQIETLFENTTTGPFGQIDLTYTHLKKYMVDDKK